MSLNARATHLAVGLSVGVVFGALPHIALGEASATAMYRVEFEGIWTPQTHPTNYPSNAHFSALIGGTHATPNLFWSEGTLASPGMKSMAETGGKTILRNEVLSRIGQGVAGVVIESGGIPGAGTGSMSIDFSISQAFPYVTLVSMIAPSPDWFVGTSDAALFVNGGWLPELVVDLQPFDAGTDSGATYASPNAATNPPTMIAELTGYPVSAGGLPSLPFATMRFTRLNAPACDADLSGDGLVQADDLALLLSGWGETGDSLADINGNGTVDAADLSELLAAWGACE
jgi:hypothetical protein